MALLTQDNSLYSKPKPHFAWIPVKTTNTDRWLWLTWVYKVVDDRPEKYQGLLPVTYYYEFE